MRLTHFCFALLVLILGAASAPAQNEPPPPMPPDYFPEHWKEYVYEKDGVKFRFPAEPEVISEKDASGTITTHAYRRRSLMELFIAVNEFPPGSVFETIPPEQHLRETRDSVLNGLKNLNPKVIREANTAVGGHPAKFIHIETSNGGVLRFKFFTVKNRQYFMSAEVRKGVKYGVNYENDFEKVAMAFLDSVGLVSPAK